jgi:hypothetical protein
MDFLARSKCAHRLDQPEVTVVELRRRGRHAGRTGRRIVTDLADYFAVTANGRSVEVSVDRGAPADAALRVAAVLDGVDTGWEEHFHLPTVDAESPPGNPQPSAPARGHLRLVWSDDDAFGSQELA